jgi:prevent-host-death family protein
MRIAPLADVKARFSSYVEQCREGPVIVTKNGRPAAVLVAVPADEGELERFVLANTPRFRRLLEAGSRKIAGGQGVHHRDFWRRVGKRQRPRRGPGSPTA